MGTSVTKIFEFSYGHRLPNHPGKCRRYHGHNGKVEVTISGEVFESTGMVIDFGDLKKMVEPLLEVWDHRMILQMGDPMIKYLSSLTTGYDQVVVVDIPPTAENLAILLMEAIQEKMGLIPSPIKITFWETEDSFATVEG